MPPPPSFSDLEPEGDRDSCRPAILGNPAKCLLALANDRGERKDIDIGPLLEKDVCGSIHARPQQAVRVGQVHFRAQGPICAQDPTRPRHLPFHDPIGKGLNAYVSAAARLDPRRVHLRNVHEDADHVGAGDGQQGFGGRGAGRLDEIPANDVPFASRLLHTGARICVYRRRVFTRDRSASALPRRARATASLALALATSAWLCSNAALADSTLARASPRAASAALSESRVSSSSLRSREPPVTS